MMLKPLMLVAVLSLPGFAIEKSKTQPLDKLQQEFIELYVAAINSNDLNAFKEITHSAYLNCINEANKDYYSNIFKKTLSRTIPNNYKVIFETLNAKEIVQEVAGAEKRAMPYPIPPSHKIQIDYNKSEYSSVSIIRNLVLDNGQYYQVSGCPGANLLERYRALEIKKKAERKQAKELFLKIEPALLKELTLLIRKGQKVQAWTRYSQATGQSIGTAKAVLSNIDLRPTL